MKTCNTCVFRHLAKCLLTLKDVPGPACEDYEEPRPPLEKKTAETWA